MDNGTEDEYKGKEKESQTGSFFTDRESIKKIHQSARLAFIFGIMSIAFGGIGIIASIPAISLGFYVKNKYKSDPDAVKEKALANIGIVLGFIGAAISLAIFLYYIFKIHS